MIWRRSGARARAEELAVGDARAGPAVVEILGHTALGNISMLGCEKESAGGR
jgi:hypothetical protein